MHIPDWLYRPLPYLYVSGGTTTAVATDSALGIGSGTILTLTGVLIWKMRVDYRREIATIMRRKKRTQEMPRLNRAP